MPQDQFIAVVDVKKQEWLAVLSDCMPRNSALLFSRQEEIIRDRDADGYVLRIALLALETFLRNTKVSNVSKQILCLVYLYKCLGLKKLIIHLHLYVDVKLGS